MRYYFDIVHVPGKQLIVADTLSRAPLAEADPGDLEPETIAYVNVIMESLPATERRLFEIKLQTEQDPILQQVLKYTKDGWPRIIREVPESIQPYWNYKSDLSVANGVLLKYTRILIPHNMRLDILEHIHAAHQGISKCRERGRNSVW